MFEEEPLYAVLFDLQVSLIHVLWFEIITKIYLEQIEVTKHASLYSRRVIEVFTSESSRCLHQSQQGV